MRGRKSEVGEDRITANGYHQVRTERGWEYTHRLIAAETLGRDIAPNERVRFIDGDRNNLAASNIEVYTTRTSSEGSRRARLEARIEDLKGQLDDLVRDDD
jgi:hypothetical protein